MHHHQHHHDVTSNIRCCMYHKARDIIARDAPIITIEAPQHEAHSSHTDNNRDNNHELSAS